MKNKIFCGIASSLGLSIEAIENVTYKAIDSKEDVHPDSEEYSLLILDKQTHSLYSGKQFRSENNFDVIAYYDKESNRTEDIVDVLKCCDNLLSCPGILSHQQIITLMRLGVLLYDGDPQRVKGASYDLIIDKEHLKSGIEVVCADTFKIDPLDYIVVGAAESVNIPKNICASFDTKVSMFCKGIILSNGPQVDPGYQGRLCCLLFNTSAKAFEIFPETKFEFSSIQFFTLSETTNKPYTGKYLRKKHLKEYIGSFADAGIPNLVKEIPDMRDSIRKLEEGCKKLGNRKYTLSSIVITAILTFITGLVIAAYGAAYYFGKLDEKINTFERVLAEKINQDNKQPKIEKKSVPNKNSGTSGPL